MIVPPPGAYAVALFDSEHYARNGTCIHEFGVWKVFAPGGDGVVRAIALQKGGVRIRDPFAQKQAAKERGAAEAD